MFNQYRKENIPFESEIIRQEGCIKIAYPASKHSTYVAGQDFYVIGYFSGKVQDENAKLRIRLKDEEGNCIRYVETDKRDNYQGIFVDAPGIISENTREEIKYSGMPDLVYDPDNPESYYYTWNKAFFTEDVFSALIYGGSYGVDEIFQYDQKGKKLQPLLEGIYKIQVEVIQKNETWITEMTVRIANHTKEIIMSRYTSPEHMKNIEYFAEKNGFEAYTDPYAGIWDTQYFSFQWPSSVTIEIPSRWYWADSQEYLTDVVHCFDYMISEKCISYEVEVGSMLNCNAKRMDQEVDCHTYYYEHGNPEKDNRFEEFKSGHYLAVTGIHVNVTEGIPVLEINTTCKVIPSEVERIFGCHYKIKNRIAYLVITCVSEESNEEEITEKLPTGIDRIIDEKNEERLILESSHKVLLKKNWWNKKVKITLQAIDCCEKCWDTQVRTLGVV